MNRSLLRGSFVVAVVASFALPAVAQEGGPPFQVNTFTANYQRGPAIATDASGGFVVAWESETQDGADDTVIARAFEATGAPRTGEVQGNFLKTLGPQFQPAVAVQPDGGFFLVWTDGFPAAHNVWLRRFTANGAPLLGTEQQVNPPLLYGNQQTPTIDADTGGHAVVVWASQNGLGSPDWTIFAKRYSAAGIPLSGDLQVSQRTAGAQDHPVVAVDPQGNFVVAWHAFGRDGSGNAVLARHFDAAGNPLGAEFLVNVTVSGNQERPWVDRDSTGRFVVAWQSEGQDGSSWGVYARRFDAAGNALSNEFKVNTHTAAFQERPVVSLTPDGRFIIVWQSASQEGTPDYGVYGQRYDAVGTPAGPEFHVNTTIQGHQYQPAVAAQPGGGFIVTWAQQQGGSLFTDLWARIYPPFGGTGDLIFADGFETGNLGGRLSYIGPAN